MTGRRQQRVVLPPINALFKFLQEHTPVQVWLYEQTNVRLEGVIRGFDEFMNIVLENAVEVNSKTDTRRELGELLLKGDNITLVAAKQ